MSTALLAVALLFPYMLGAVATALIVADEPDSKTIHTLLLRSLTLLLTWWLIIIGGLSAFLIQRVKLRRQLRGQGRK